MKTRILLILAISTICMACQKHSLSKQGTNDEYAEFDMTCDTIVLSDVEVMFHAHIQYWDFDKIENLTAFFDSLSIEHPVVQWNELDSLWYDVSICVSQLDNYRKGKRRFYPDSLVWNCIDAMAYDVTLVSDHYEHTDFVYLEWFMMCAAYYSPDITYLIDAQSPDHNAGFKNIGYRYFYSPWMSYLFLKRSKGFEMVRLDHNMIVHSIFQLSDEQGRVYYLYANNKKLGFHQWLYWAKDEDDIHLVAESDNLPLDLEESECYYFNPKTFVWKYAREDNQTGKLIAIGENPAMTLVLDGEQSHFDIGAQ